ncbi:hypothetical protein QAD02_015877, partial [Eretmocerus hayati]
AVKLESVHPGRTRYLVVVSCTGRQDAEESCLLGIDCNDRATVGLVLRVLADTAITLDGDGGFSVSVCGCQHIFKPVSVQAMWSALQTLHKVSSKAREHNYFLGGLTHDWVSYYEQRIESDRSCLNEWNAMDNLESRRPPSPDSVRNKPRERDETERVIRSTLKEIMMSVDLDEVTSKYIRGRLEEDLDMDLGEFKPFIDQEMLTILGQMDAPTEIFDHVYLGSEWNASNLEELQKNGVRHILNVTREIDNFFPGMFNYLNVRVYDDEKTDLLKHWDDTFKYITKAKKEGSKVLVHCKMGVSRSASVVIAYAMKAYNWDFSQALKHVKEKRNCIKPNNSFLLQLETYQGILDAMKNKEKLQRSKSDTNLKSPTALAAAKEAGKKESLADDLQNDDDDETSRGSDELNCEDDEDDERSGAELKKSGQRPKSWSPNDELVENVLPNAQLSHSLESIGKPEVVTEMRLTEDLVRCPNTKTGSNSSNVVGNVGSNVGSGVENMQQESRNVLMPCDNGQSYSVSQNQIVHLPGPDSTSSSTGSTTSSPNGGSCLSAGCRHYSQQIGQQKRKGLVLNLTTQFEAASSKPSSPSSDGGCTTTTTTASTAVDTRSTQQLQQQLGVSPLLENGCCGHDESSSENQVSGQPLRNAANTSEGLVWAASTEVKCIPANGPGNLGSCIEVETSTTGTSATRKPKKEGDLFSAQVDHVFDREERREPTSQQQQQQSTVVRQLPSRQSSWSSYDSAVVMDNNSVHSSWATLPSRNSSWGSYDMRGPVDSLGSSGLFPYDREEIPWHPGTVKRTKQKLEESSSTGTSKRVCTQGSEPAERLSGPSITEPESENCCSSEAYNPMLLHYGSSPTPRRRDPSPLPDHRQRSHQQHTRSGGAPPIDISPSHRTSNVPSNSQTNRRTTRSSGSNNSGNPTLNGRLSTSAPLPSSLTPETAQQLRSCRSESETASPCVVKTPQCSSVKHYKMVLENLCNRPSPKSRRGSSLPLPQTTSNDDATSTSTLETNTCSAVDSSSPLRSSTTTSCPATVAAASSSSSSSGIVKNLKKEFEAKSSSRPEQRSPDATEQQQRHEAPRVRSLPSSPVIAHAESKIHQQPQQQEDLSVRSLVGKYEVAQPPVQLRSSSSLDQPGAVTRSPGRPEFARRSAPLILPPQHSLFTTDSGRPPPASPGQIVVASVVAKAASKKQQQQQHGRTHPLARLQVRPRHSSPVYNTM